MDSTTFISLVTALAALIGAISPIIVPWIQSKIDKSKQSKHIALPPGVNLPRPKTEINWVIVLSFAFLGGIVGYSAAKFANTIPLSLIPKASNLVSANTTIPADMGDLMPTSKIFSTSIPTMIAQVTSATSNSVLFEEDFENGKAEGISYI